MLNRLEACSTTEAFRGQHGEYQWQPREKQVPYEVGVGHLSARDHAIGDQRGTNGGRNDECEHREAQALTTNNAKKSHNQSCVLAGRSFSSKSRQSIQCLMKNFFSVAPGKTVSDFPMMGRSAVVS